MDVNESNEESKEKIEELKEPNANEKRKKDEEPNIEIDKDNDPKS